MNFETTTNNKESIISKSILELATHISPQLGKFNAGIFGGVATWAYSNGRRLVRDLDILCPQETIDNLSRALSDQLKTFAELSPVGYDLTVNYQGANFNIDIMSCSQTDKGLVLPFGVVSQLPMQCVWQDVGQKSVLVVSKDILREMKAGSSRSKDKDDLWMIAK